MTALLIRRVADEVWELVASRDGLPPYDRLALGTRAECDAEYNLAAVGVQNARSAPKESDADSDPSED